MKTLERIVLFTVAGAFYAVWRNRSGLMGHMVRDDFKIALLPAWRAWENYTCALDLSRRCALECERRYWKQVALKSLDAYFMRIEREAAIIDVPPAWRKLAGVK